MSRPLCFGTLDASHAKQQAQGGSFVKVNILISLLMWEDFNGRRTIAAFQPWLRGCVCGSRGGSGGGGVTGQGAWGLNGIVWHRLALSGAAERASTAEQNIWEHCLGQQVVFKMIAARGQWAWGNGGVENQDNQKDSWWVANWQWVYIFLKYSIHII